MKIIKTGGWVLSIIFFLILTNAQTIVKKPYGHPDYVPNKETAIKVAVAIWLPIYGSEIYQDTPYNATLKNSSVWIITGSFSGDEFGGVPYIEIQKRDCKILKVTHGK